MAVEQQPEKREMNLMGDDLPGCPPGLEYLAQIDSLQVHQTMELFEVFTGWETRNRYVVNNCLGQRTYYAMEESTAFMRNCCGPSRAFVLHITDNYQQEVLRITREFKCCAGCCWCAGADSCAYEAVVEAPVGTTIGYVRQAASGCSPHAKIMDANRDPIMTMWGPCCPVQGPGCTDDINLNELQNEPAQVGYQKIIVTISETEYLCLWAHFTLNGEFRRKVTMYPNDRCIHCI
ncbi:phospholipid scramblase 1-like isoform X2 [Ptychodera flava]|uniref:phospholipid scramblase 1-like isoform X2 n=1 Tax=Ptychodera flava TaxID=63121 RepID=UPI00396A4DDC